MATADRKPTPPAPILCAKEAGSCKGRGDEEALHLERAESRGLMNGTTTGVARSARDAEPHQPGGLRREEPKKTGRQGEKLESEGATPDTTNHCDQARERRRVGSDQECKHEGETAAGPHREPGRRMNRPNQEGTEQEDRPDQPVSRREDKALLTTDEEVRLSHGSARRIRRSPTSDPPPREVGQARAGQGSARQSGARDRPIPH